MRKIFGLLLLTLFVSGALAQRYTSESKKAIKYYEEALGNYERYEFELAIENMHKAIKADESFIEAYIVLAEIYTDYKQPLEAIKTYHQVIEINKDFYPQIFYNLGMLEMGQEMFVEAKEHLEILLTFKITRSNVKVLALKQLANCDFAIDAMENPVSFEPVNMGEGINSEYNEYWPSLTADERILVFTRLQPKNPDFTPGLDVFKMSDFQEDFYISFFENNDWTEAVNAGEPLNSADNEGAQSLSADGKEMFFTACNRTEGLGSCDIYVSNWINKNWSEPMNLGSPVNTAGWDAHPSISPDGKNLYFVSNRGGGKGGKDIWMSIRNADGTWNKPVNLSDSINTPEDEISPFIHSDNRTLYFASNGRVGIGGDDLYMAEKINAENWSMAINLGYPINTANDEAGLIINAQGNRAFYASDRIPEKGEDIYYFEIPPEIRPTPVSYMKGKVYDSQTKKPLKAKFEIISLESGKTIMNAESDFYTGEFLVCIPTDEDYALNVSREQYLFYSDNFLFKGIHDAVNPYVKDVPLQPIKEGEKIILKNIFYAHDSYELDNKSIVEMTKLIDFLNANPSVRVEISGHTDDTGDDQYNMGLSENRAKSVVSYLVEQGIVQDRLTYKGYGESEPIESNSTPEGKKANRRTEFMIIGK